MLRSSEEGGEEGGGSGGAERSKYTHTIIYLFFQNIYLQLRNGKKKWDFPHFPLGLPDFSGRKFQTL